MSALLFVFLIDLNPQNPIVRDVLLLLISFLLVIGTLYVFFRLRTSTFRRVRRLLEQRVEVKTKQLVDKNLELEQLSLVASKTDNGVIIANINGEVQWANDGFYRMTGKASSVAGMNLSQLDVYQHLDSMLDQAKFEEHLRTFESEFIHPSGKKMWISTTLTPIIENDKMRSKLLFVDTDITEGKLLQQQLVTSLREKEVLLKEIHHRVKNNLQIIISLLNLQSGYIKDEETLKAVKDGQNRVRSMALVHEKFYQAEEIGEIDFQEYSEKLCHFLLQSYGNSKNDIEIKINAKGIAFDMDTAMPCGLFITEVVSNAIKYAFPGGKGIISIDFEKQAGNKINLKIYDNGIGLPEGVSIEKSDSLGFQLIIALANQLDGELTVATESGAHFYLTFTYPKS